MSRFLDEEVPAVNPLSTVLIEKLANCFLQQFSPEILERPQALDVAELVDTKLPKYGIHVSPASNEELGHRAAATDPSGTGEIQILVSEEVWEGIELAPPKSFYPRATICHEVGHALLHVPILRKRLQVNNVLARTQRRNLKPYEDPEWQAWAFAGAILMPRKSLDILNSNMPLVSTETVSNTFEVSNPMARNHLTRIKWPSVI